MKDWGELLASKGKEHLVYFFQEDAVLFDNMVVKSYDIGLTNKRNESYSKRTYIKRNSELNKAKMVV